MRWKGKKPSAFADSIESDLGENTRAIALQALSGVIERSPVDEGVFRGNNRVSVGRRDSGYNLEATDKTGGATLAAGNSVIASTRNAPYTVIYIQNNLPYAGVIENGGFVYRPGGKTTPAGYSIQAPQGVFAVTFNDLMEANR